MHGRSRPRAHVISLGSLPSSYTCNTTKKLDSESSLHLSYTSQPVRNTPLRKQKSTEKDTLRVYTTATHVAYHGRPQSAALVAPNYGRLQPAEQVHGRLQLAAYVASNLQNSSACYRGKRYHGKPRPAAYSTRHRILLALIHRHLSSILLDRPQQPPKDGELGDGF